MKQKRDDGLLAVIAFFILYGALHGAIIRAAGPTLALDDVKLNVLTQAWRAGYLPVNPPLYEWGLITVQQLTGPTLLSFIIVKYIWLTVAGAFTYLALLEIFRLPLVGDDRSENWDTRWAAAGAVSITLFYQIGWNYHQAFTHTTVLIAATAFFWWAFMRFMAQATLSRWLVLGVAIGVGLLSKYSFAASSVLAIAAACRYGAGRASLLKPAIFVSLLVAVIIVSPHLFWILSQNAELAETAAARLQGPAQSQNLIVAFLGRMINASWAVLAYFLFFLPVVVVLFGRHVLTLRGPDAPLPAIIARDAAVIGGGFLILGAALFGIESLQERYVIPFLFPALFWVVYRIAAGQLREGEGGGQSSKAQEKNPCRLIMATIGVAVFIAGARIVEVVVAGPPFCGGCRQWVPYDQLAEKIEARDLHQGSLVAQEDHTAGNLRRLFPGARVLSTHLPMFTPPIKRSGMGAPPQGQPQSCTFIWSPDLGPAPSNDIIARFDPETTVAVVAPWRHWRRENGWRVTRWTIAPLDHDPALAKALCRY